MNENPSSPPFNRLEDAWEIRARYFLDRANDRWAEICWRRGWLYQQQLADLPALERGVLYRLPAQLKTLPRADRTPRRILACAYARDRCGVDRATCDYLMERYEIAAALAEATLAANATIGRAR
jgi:hypothetical protein